MKSVGIAIFGSWVSLCKPQSLCITKHCLITCTFVRHSWQNIVGCTIDDTFNLQNCVCLHSLRGYCNWKTTWLHNQIACNRKTYWRQNWNHIVDFRISCMLNLSCTENNITNHSTSENNIRKAISEIESLNEVQKVTALIRVEK